MEQEGGYIDDTLIKLLDGTSINNDPSTKNILNTIRFIESKNQIERDELLKTINNYTLQSHPKSNLTNIYNQTQ